MSVTFLMNNASLLKKKTEPNFLNCGHCIICPLFLCLFQVYNRVCREPVLPLSARLHRLRSHCGAVAGSIFSFVAVITFLFLLFLQWLRPDHLIDVAVDSSGPHSRLGQHISKKTSKTPNPAVS